MCKILGISGSYTDGATEYALKVALENAAKVSGEIETELLLLRNYKLEPCINCNYCIKNNARCRLEDDTLLVMEKFFAADGYILASPVYTYNPTPLMLTMFNKMRCMRDKVPGLFGKAGGALAVGGSRSGGQETTVGCLINCLLSRNIVAVGGSTGHFNYTGGKLWTQNKGADGAREDEIGNTSVADVGDRVARVCLMLRGGQG